MNLAPDEALMSGFYRASLANDVRTGKPESLTPEISLEGGKTWVNNDALTAKQNRHPIVRVCRNANGTVVVGQNPVLNAKPLDVTFKVKELQDTIRLRDREIYMGRVQKKLILVDNLLKKRQLINVN
ncbi:hypothetical protein [Siphonobacter sp. SORGH_AS_1065]|uniref:hypothetical protein n=1 Tax=Siphonobacter sp. SORGH_AS_1065 TaxID=3041795 RepID=UPI0027837334|nr:hypothetical protein [Siphonobacter sp. SORGH_AS_1065]MDQ1085691.1 hypothetical protein [Siphonobacter sp. SORGH_AS_1065]